MTIRRPFDFAGFQDAGAAIAAGEMAIVDTGLGVLIGVPIAREPGVFAGARTLRLHRLGDGIFGAVHAPAPDLPPCDVEP
ncbi:hypothetical protein RA307_30855 [Xanthobacteraceae bacterium Astr-EGSB]|uniref:hypothetical protein n=1 Tax=Astrobacterium formosum TaxID=3069710 RepID=UPI0027B1CEC0|nr:hypothetical protein [Xanthobacteraceae bacterium Astr-EGSB]